MVPKVTQEPKTCPQTRLTAPSAPMDMVISGASPCSEASRVTARSRSTSREVWGITASFRMSAPAASIFSRAVFITSVSGVPSK